jgi:hypothetical protein
MARAVLLQQGLLLFTNPDSNRTAWMEGAPLRRRCRGGHLPVENSPFRFSKRVHRGHGGKKRLGVGMSRSAADLLHHSQLNDLPKIHHGDAVTHVPDHPQVMRDEEIGQVEFMLQTLQEIEDLRPDGDVQRRNGFIGDDEPGV